MDSTNLTPDELRRRWEDSGSPQLLLQTVEAFRREGRLAEGVGLLEKGLVRNPDHISALVALGRLLLDLGDSEAAIEPLKKVVEGDATHFVANKLLAEAYLGTGKLREARDRLDFYTLMNEDDPDIERLESALNASADSDDREAGTAQVADESVPTMPLAEAGADIFDLNALGALPATTAPSRSISTGSGAGLRIASSADPFEYLQSSTIEKTETAPSIGPRPDPVVVEPSPETEMVVPAEISPTVSVDSSGSPGPAEQEEIPPAGDPLARTATLGELYLFQGHHGEAEEIFREVLARAPHDRKAWSGLRQAQNGEGLWLTAAELLRESEGKALASGTVRERKILLMGRYLERVRAARLKWGRGEAET